MAALVDSWLLHLRAERKSQQTLKAYGQGIRLFMGWCREHGEEPTLSKDSVNRFVVAQIEAGKSSATVAARQLSVRRFSAWCADEGEIAADELAGLKMPKIAVTALAPLTDEELRALFDACKGKSFVDRRDEALARFMAETMARAEDTLSMTIANTDIRRGQACIIGKGSKPRIVAWGAQTGVALDRYLRMRRAHKLAHTDAFWLGGRDRTFGYDGLYGALCARAEAAGIENFQGPHQLRRTGATRWRRAGGSESGLMAAAGWKSLAMVQRYTEFTKQELAAEEARGLNLGDL
jgi:integrase/recombinase XerD